MHGAATIAMMAKQATEYHQATSRRELVDKVPLFCASLRACTFPRVRDNATAASYLEVY